MTEPNQQANAYLATQPVGTLLLKFSVPCVLSMLVSTLYNIIDQIFIGQSVGYLGNATTNVVYPFTVATLALLTGDGSAALPSLLGQRGQGNKPQMYRKPHPADPLGLYLYRRYSAAFRRNKCQLRLCLGLYAYYLAWGPLLRFYLGNEFRHTDGRFARLFHVCYGVGSGT